MPVNSGKEWTFNTVADTYGKIRPGYPDELYQALFAYAPLNGSRSALEIGIGGGQATLPVLKTGCALTAVEYCNEVFSQRIADFPRTDNNDPHDRTSIQKSIYFTIFRD